MEQNFKMADGGIQSRRCSDEGDPPSIPMYHAMCCVLKIHHCTRETRPAVGVVLLN